MLKQYMIKLVMRVLIVTGVFALYFYDRDLLLRYLHEPIWTDVNPIGILWCVFMLIMLCHLVPIRNHTMARKKALRGEYVPVANYSEPELAAFVRKQNARAWVVMLVWLGVNAVFGFLYYSDVIGEAELFVLSVFYFLCDYICILFYCPFQSFIMGSRCCVNCRIYDWGHFMMFTPLAFVPNVYTWSLFAMSLVVLIHWEIVCARHPERIWSGSNKRIQCVNCKDKTCQIKTAIRNSFK